MVSGFRRLCSEFRLDVNACCELLRRCGIQKDLRQARLAHDRIIRSGLGEDVFLANSLITMYSKCGGLEEAWRVFQSIRSPNLVSWTAMISAFSRNDHPEPALRTFRLMILAGCKPDEVTMIALFDACQDFEAGRKIHSAILHHMNLISNIKVLNSIMSMYSRCGELEQAENIFDSIPQKDTISWNSMIAAYAKRGHLLQAEELFNQMPERNVVSWTAMVNGYSEHGFPSEALKYFREMNLIGEKPNQVTVLAVLDACMDESQSGTVESVLPVILEIGLRSDVVVSTALINVYGKHGEVVEARKIFHSIPNKTTVTWSSMIQALSRNECNREAMKTFRLMDHEGLKPSMVTFLNAIEACSESVELVRMIDSRIHQTCGLQTRLGNSLVNVYGKHGLVSEARSVFDRITHKNSVSWSVVIDVHAQNGLGREALLLFKLMDLEGVEPEEITYTILFYACASIPSLQQGQALHAEWKQSQKSSTSSGLHLQNSIIDMFGKCGSSSKAKQVFDEAPNRDVISWTAMVSAFAENGADHEALELAQEMKLHGFNPNEITLSSVLVACSRAGLLEDAIHNFQCMTEDFGVEASLEHYVCLIDLLARSGRLQEAEALLNEMPYEPDTVAWTTMLGGSKIHGDGRKATGFATNASNFEEHPANYVLLSQVYASENERVSEKCV